MVYVTWPRWPPCPYIVKSFKNLLFLNQKADDLESSYAALVTRVLPNLFKRWLWVDLYIFYSKVKFGLFCFYMGKCLSCRFPRNYWSLWGESWYIYSQINEYIMIYETQPRSMSFTDLCPRSLRFNIFKLLFKKKKKKKKPFEAKFHKKPAWDVKLNFIKSLHGMLGWKFIQIFWVTWPRWLPGPYMVKTLKNLLLSEPRVRWPWNLVYSNAYSSTTKFVQMMTPGWPWPFLWHVQICFLMLLYGWKLI